LESAAAPSLSPGLVTQSNAPLVLVANVTTLAGGVSGSVPLTLSSTPVPGRQYTTLTNSGTLLLTSADSSTSTISINAAPWCWRGHRAAVLHNRASP